MVTLYSTSSKSKSLKIMLIQTFSHTCQLNPLDLHCRARSTSTADHTLPAEQNAIEPEGGAILTTNQDEQRGPEKSSTLSSRPTPLLPSTVFAHPHFN